MDHILIFRRTSAAQCHSCHLCRRCAGVPVYHKEEEYYEAMDQAARRSLEENTNYKVPEDVKNSHFVAGGDAVDNIIERAEQEKVDLVVIARHGRTGWRKFFSRIGHG